LRAVHPVSGADLANRIRGHKSIRAEKLAKPTFPQNGRVRRPRRRSAMCRSSGVSASG